MRGENTIYREEEEIRTKLTGRKEQDTIHLAKKNMRTHFRYRRYRRMETRAELTQTQRGKMEKGRAVILRQQIAAKRGHRVSRSKSKRSGMRQQQTNKRQVFAQL